MAPRKQGLAAVAATGNRRASLEALRDLLAKAMQDTSVAARDLAALSRQLTQVMAELEDLRDVKVVTPLDELRNKRAARGTDTTAV
jgi:hypothetical protein